MNVKDSLCFACALGAFAMSVATAQATFVTPGAPAGDDLGAITSSSPPTALADNQFAFASNPWNVRFALTGDSPVYFPVAVDTTDPGNIEFDVFFAIENRSSQTWLGVRFELGFGTGTGFVSSQAGDNLDFDAPDRDNYTSSGGAFDSNYFQFLGFLDAYLPTVWEEDLMEWSGGTPASPHPDDTFAPNFSFAIDVPDTISAFTLKITPITASGRSAIPEPASGALVALGVGCAALRRRRRAS